MLTAKAIFTVKEISVSAFLIFNKDGQLINFVSEDRYVIAEKSGIAFQHLFRSIGIFMDTCCLDIGSLCGIIRMGSSLTAVLTQLMFNTMWSKRMIKHLYDFQMLFDNPAVIIY